MALSGFARGRMEAGLANTDAANDLATIIDAGSGTVGDRTRLVLRTAVGSQSIADEIVTAIEADTDLSGREFTTLARLFGTPTALEINGELG